MRQCSGSLGAPSRREQFADYLEEGVLHIWTGFDHILFLLSLLLPAVLVRSTDSTRRWAAVPSFKAAFTDVFKVVTAFTVAHSITLSLAALGVVSLPSRLVESAIAVSVVLAALNNVRSVVYGGRWIIAFCFGLIHGFGFASVLTDLGLPQESLLLALVAFNVGVELGQLAIVAVFLPIASALRDTRLYRRAILVGGSLLVAAIAMLWLIERAFNVALLARLGA
jgi:HupE/UreJ protein